MYSSLSPNYQSYSKFSFIHDFELVACVNRHIIISRVERTQKCSQLHLCFFYGFQRTDTAIQNILRERMTLSAWKLCNQLYKSIVCSIYLTLRCKTACYNIRRILILSNYLRLSKEISLSEVNIWYATATNTFMNYICLTVIHLVLVVINKWENFIICISLKDIKFHSNFNVTFHCFIRVVFEHFTCTIKSICKSALRKLSLVVTEFS